jgi:hypothetical protein
MTYHLLLTSLQAALYARLDSILTVGVLDQSIGNHSFPYASIGEFTVRPSGNKCTAVIDVEAPIHIWSNYEGAKECQETADTILASLTGTPLTISGHSILESTFSGFTTAAEQGTAELLRHGVLTMRWLIQ